MFNLLAGMNTEKLVNSFVMGMKPEKKAEVIAKLDEGLELARKTSEDFETIKQQNNEIKEMLDRLLIPETIENIEVENISIEKNLEV